MTVYGFLATILIVIVPVATELYETKKYLNEKNSVRDGEIDVTDYEQGTDEGGARPPSNGVRNGIVGDSRKCSAEKKLRMSSKLFVLENIETEAT